MSNENIFLNGLIIKAPRNGAPEFVKGSISIKREELITSLSALDDEWINLDIKNSKKGEWYASINNWKPNANKNQEKNTQSSSPQQSSGDDFSDDIPF